MEKELFGAALGVSEPVYINEIVFDMTAGELHIHMDFRRGGRFGCSECGATELGVHDTVEKTWRHLNFLALRYFEWVIRKRIWSTSSLTSPAG